MIIYNPGNWHHAEIMILWEACENYSCKQPINSAECGISYSMCQAILTEDLNM